MLRRLHHEQPESFAFTPANLAWAEAQITKYPEGRQASAIIPLLWRAQEQEGWLTRPAIEHVADMLGMAYIRALEVATFYFMFQLQPVGSVAHIQVCGTTSCMICGAEDLIAVCREKIAPNAAPAVGRRQVQLGRGRMPRRLRQRADGADRQGLLRGPDRRAAGRDPRRAGRGQGAGAGAAERPLCLGAAERADQPQGARSRAAPQYNASVEAALATARYGEADRRHRGAAGAPRGRPRVRPWRPRRPRHRRPRRRRPTAPQAGAPKPAAAAPAGAAGSPRGQGAASRGVQRRRRRPPPAARQRRSTRRARAARTI